MIRPLGSHKWTRFSSIKLAAEAMSQPYTTIRGRCHRNSQVDGYEYKFAPVQQVELPGEEWHPMIDPRSGRRVPGRYVSSQGRIKSKAGYISCGHSRADGYLSTLIKLDSSTRYQVELVHRLVAASFVGLPPSPEHSQVNHKDGNKSNNAKENLEYVTPAENLAHHFASRKGYNPLSKAVLSRACGTNQEWTHHPSITHAAKTWGLHRGTVSACARGLQKQTHGYEFRFAEPEPLVVETLTGEEWREVDLEAHLWERQRRQHSFEDNGWVQHGTHRKLNAVSRSTQEDHAPFKPCMARDLTQASWLNEVSSGQHLLFPLPMTCKIRETFNSKSATSANQLLKSYTIIWWYIKHVQTLKFLYFPS